MGLRQLSALCFGSLRSAHSSHFTLHSSLFIDSLASPLVSPFGLRFAQSISARPSPRFIPFHSSPFTFHSLMARVALRASLRSVYLGSPHASVHPSSLIHHRSSIIAHPSSLIHHPSSRFQIFTCSGSPVSPPCPSAFRIAFKLSCKPRRNSVKSVRCMMRFIPARLHLISCSTRGRL